MSYGYSSKIRAFYDISEYDFIDQMTGKVKNEIESKGKEYILGIDEEEFRSYLMNKYLIEPLIIDFAKEQLGEPTINQEWVEEYYNPRGGKVQRDVYTFTVSYPFTGSSALFSVRPNPCAMTSEDIMVSENRNVVSFSFVIYKQDVNDFNKAKNDYFNRAFTNYKNINLVADKWNNQLNAIINSTFQTRKDKFLKENDFFTAINVKVNPNTSSVFTTPTILKKTIQQPNISKTKEFSSEPTMANEMYNGVLKVIYDSGKSMERKPALYNGKDEEGLRDMFLFVLETRYEGITATGETFNRSGKTDIILKYANDGTNLFVAECKFWHGSSEFLKAISQLFDRYLTWRDSKVALILFVTNVSFTAVLETITSDIKTHEYFVRENGKRGESSFSYIFHLPQDENKQVYFEVILFHYDK